MNCRLSLLCNSRSKIGVFVISQLHESKNTIGLSGFKSSTSIMKLIFPGVYQACTYCDVIKSHYRDPEENGEVISEILETY